MIALPAKCLILACKGHGASNWNQTGRIDTELIDGTNKESKSYFLKVSSCMHLLQIWQRDSQTLTASMWMSDLPATSSKEIIIKDLS